MVQITRKAVCRQIRNSVPFFVTPWPTSRTLVDLLDVFRLRARCSQAMLNFQILDIFNFPRAPPTHLIKVPKEGLALHLPISPRGWATPTLKSFKLCQKHAHIKKVLNKIVWLTIFCPTTQFCRVAGPFAGHFFQNVPECALNHLHYFSVL